MESDLVMHHGGCHCRRVRWRVQAPSSVVAWNCNCSVCSMRGIIQFVVPSEKFELLGDSKECLTTYTFGTHTAKHTFCKFCGITSFYVPRSFPDGVSISSRCVDPGTLTHVEIKHFDGRNWESSYEQEFAPRSQGFKKVIVAGCGPGPERGSKCGVNKFELCDNASEYLFFDRIHPADEARYQFAKLMWNGNPDVAESYNLKTLFEE